MTMLVRLFILAVVISFLALPAVSFSPRSLAPRSVFGPRSVEQSKNRLFAAASSPDDDVARQLVKAKDLLARAKEKLNDGEKTVEIALTSDDGVVKEKDTERKSEKEESSLPFFAQQDQANKREMVTKSKDEATGLITVDGEKLAEISGSEQWETRSLLEVFQNELSDKQSEAYSLAKKQLADRDVAASIWNLRKSLKTEDFDKIFDKRNRFIGEE